MAEWPLWPVVGQKSPKLVLLEAEDAPEDIQSTRTVNFNDGTVIIVTNLKMIKSNHPVFTLALLVSKYTVCESKLSFSFSRLWLPVSLSPYLAQHPPSSSPPFPADYSASYPKVFSPGLVWASRSPESDSCKTAAILATDPFGVLGFLFSWPLDSLFSPPSPQSLSLSFCF